MGPSLEDLASISDRLNTHNEDRAAFKAELEGFIQRGATTLEAVFNDVCFGDRPVVSITLGSGMGSLKEEVEQPQFLDFRDLDLPPSSTPDHESRIYVGKLNGENVLVQSGRLHANEGLPAWAVGILPRMQALAGIKNFIVTNAAGALDANFNKGDLVVLTNHDPGTADDPGFGLHGDILGAAKFYGMTYPYDAKYGEAFTEAAAELGYVNDVHHGAYVYKKGGRYETATEIAILAAQREALIARGDERIAPAVVGMSTVIEVMALCHMKTIPAFKNLRILGISNVTNLGAGLKGSMPNEQEVIDAGIIGGRKIMATSKAMIERGTFSHQ